MTNIFRIFFAGWILLLSGCATQVWIPDWKETSHINTPRAGTASVLVKDKIYLIGGVDGNNFLNTTEYAQVNKDGTLGPWKFGHELNEARGFTDAVVHGDFVYVAGGGNGPFGHHLLNSVERARIQADGTLGPWQLEKNSMVVARRCSHIIATDKALYTFGGFGGVLLDSVEYAEIHPDGSLGEWQLDPKVMTMPRYVGTVKNDGDTFYVIGGHDQSKGIGITDVEWSRPTADETLQTWQATSPLQQGRYAVSSSAYGNYIYALGGISGAEYLDSIERTAVMKDGQLEPWRTVAHLDQPRANFSTVDNNDVIYVLAGTNRGGYLSSVIFANRNANGDIGYWGSKEEAEAAKTRSIEREKIKSQLPNEGVVQEVLQTQGYTYARVTSNKGGDVWLAGPKIADLKVGDNLGYSEGVSMPNFFSKELQRNFTVVIFVGQAQKK